MSDPAPLGETTGEGYRIEPIDGGVVFRLERPARLNAITRPMLAGLADCLDTLEAGGSRLLVIAAAGDRAFCAGTDLAELQGMTDAQRLDKSAMARDLFVRISRSPVLSVAAINGLAFGGGLEIAMACTLRVASRRATFSLPEIRLGLLPAYGGTQFLTALVGRARALDLMLTARVLGADEAAAIGLVDRVLAEGADAVAAATELGAAIIAFAPEAIDGIRRCVALAGERVTDAGLALEDAVVREVFVTANAREGVAAFLEKRPPRFTRRA